MSDYEKVYKISFDISNADKALRKLEKALEKIEKSNAFFQLKAISNVLKDIDKNAAQTGKTIRKELGRKARKDIDKLGKASKKAAKDMDEIPKSAKRVNISLADVGRNLNRFVLAPLAALGALSLKAATDMNKGMANVSTLVDQTPTQLREMKREAQDTMMEFGKGADDVTGGLYQVISALGESEENISQLKVASKAAVAGLSETSDAVNMLTAVGKAYNDTSAESIQHTSDLAFQTVKLGVTTFPELAASIGKVAPLAAQFNTSQEELFGTMATLTGVTGSTSEVTTQLASVYSAFMKPSEAMEDALVKINKQNKEYNFKTVSAMVKTLGFKKSVELMGKAAGGSEEKLMAMFRRKEAILAVLPLISSQSDNYTKKLEAMHKASGATDEAFKKQTEGINAQGFQLEKTKQRLIVFAQRLGDRLIPILDKVLTKAEPFLKWLENLDDESIDSAIAIGRFVGEMVILVNVLSKLSSMGNLVGTLSGIGRSAEGSVGGVNKLTGSFNKMLGVVGLLIAAYELANIAKNRLAEKHEKELGRQRKGAAIRRAFNRKDLSSLTDEQLKEEQAKQVKELQVVKKDDYALHFGDTEKNKRDKNLAEQREIVSKIENEIQLRKDPTSRVDELPAPQAGRGGGGSLTDPWGGGRNLDFGSPSQQSVINMPVNINVSENKKGKMSDNIDRRLKEMARKLEQDGYSIRKR